MSLAGIMALRGPQITVREPHGHRFCASSILTVLLNPNCWKEQPKFSGRTGVALPNFLHDDGRIIPGFQPGYTWKKILADIIENNRGWSWVVRLIKHLPGYDDRNWQWPLCACAFIARDLFFEAGGFDEQYFMYMEDVEFGLEIARVGGTVASLDFTVRHHSQLGSSVSLAYRMTLLNTARLQYAHRHYGKCFERLLRLLIPVPRHTAAERD